MENDMNALEKSVGWKTIGDGFDGGKRIGKNQVVGEFRVILERADVGGAL